MGAEFTASPGGRLPLTLRGISPELAAGFAVRELEAVRGEMEVLRARLQQAG